LQLSFDADYNNARLVSNTYLNPNYLVLPGERLPEAPLFNFNAIARYERNVSRNLTGFVQFDVAHKDSMWNDLQVDLRSLQPQYTLGNLRFGVQRLPRAWTVEAYVQNIADKRAVIYRNITGYDSYPGYTNPEILTPPRTYGLRLSYRFSRS
jgi:outer membrane receptor protein involved in Fe transport